MINCLTLPALCLPRAAELFCYVSPILGQVRISASKIEAQQGVHATGGAGSIWLQVRVGVIESCGACHGWQHCWKV